MKHPGGDKEYEAVSDNETGDDDASEEEDLNDVQESGNNAQYVPGVYPSIEEDPELLALDQRVLGLEATKTQAKAIPAAKKKKKIKKTLRETKGQKA